MLTNITKQRGVCMKRAKKKRSDISEVVYLLLGLCVFFVLVEHFEPLQKVFIFIDYGFKAILAIFLFGVVGVIILPIWAMFFDQNCQKSTKNSGGLSSIRLHLYLFSFGINWQTLRLPLELNASTNILFSSSIKRIRGMYPCGKSNSMFLQ